MIVLVEDPLVWVLKHVLEHAGVFGDGWVYDVVCAALSGLESAASELSEELGGLFVGDFLGSAGAADVYFVQLVDIPRFAAVSAVDVRHFRSP